jgi:NAD(P)-dependent dehydrogenase (short-subunit alcohol dehydrogenase family)/acyl carrier protein
MPTAGSALVDRLVDQLLAEIVARATDLVVAYRGGERLVQTFERVRLERDARPIRSLRQGGVYLITGGLGRVGLLLAEELARTARAKLALLTRAALPEPAAWDGWLAAHDPQHPVSRTIGRLRGLEQQGAEVLVLSADVADPEQMCAALRRIDERFGALHGIIHAAGSMTARSGLLPIAQLGPAESEAQFRAKVYGLYVLDELLRDRALDFCLLCSSNAAILGGLGFAAYAAANLFMDAFAAACTSAGRTPWISANWDTWLTAETTPSAADTYAMTADEGIEAFRRVVTQATVSQVLVSPGDLPARLQVWIRHEFAGAARPASVPHRRPGLPTDYIAPESDLEQAIARIWQETLGVEQVGLEDNFFELGGNSLIAIQAIARLKDELQIQIPVSRLYERLTIKALVELLAPEHQHLPAERDGEQFKEKENRALWRKQYQQSRRSKHQDDKMTR